MVRAPGAHRFLESSQANTPQSARRRKLTVRPAAVVAVVILVLAGGSALFASLARETPLAETPLGSGVQGAATNFSVQVGSNVTEGEAPLAVQFWSNTSGATPPCTYLWNESLESGNWPTNNFGTAAVANYTFTAAGTYRVLVRVTCSTATAWGQEMVDVLEPGQGGGLSVAISATPPSAIGPVTVQFTTTVSGGTAPYSYLWTLFNGTNSTGPNLTVDFGDPGAYGIGVLVKDSKGVAGNASYIYQVFAANGTEPFNVSLSTTLVQGKIPLNVAINTNVTGGTGPFSFSWTTTFVNESNGETMPLPVNATAFQPDFRATFTVPGEYMISVTVSEANETYEPTYDAVAYAGPASPLGVPISLQASPKPPFPGSGDDTLGSLGVYVTYSVADCYGSTGCTANISLGDGLDFQNCTGLSNPTQICTFAHIYAQAGTYTITATASDAFGDHGSTEITVTVPYPAPVAWLVVNASGPEPVFEGPAPLTVQFAAAWAGGVAPFQTTWRFGDSGEANAANVTHQYVHPGSYNASFEVVDAKGQAAFANASVEVYVGNGTGIPLTVSFSATPSWGAIPLTVNFTATAQGGAPPYSLQFCSAAPSVCSSALEDWNGGNWSTNATYIRAGTYLATVEVIDAAGVDQVATASINATAGPGLNASTAIQGNQGAGPLTVTFSVIPHGGTAPYAIQWAFGDGTFGSSTPGAAFTHIYLNSGTFHPQVTVRDASGQVVQVEAGTVVVNPTTGGLAMPFEGLTGVQTVVAAGTLVAVAVVGFLTGYLVWRRRVRGRMHEDGLALLEALEASPSMEPRGPRP